MRHEGSCHCGAIAFEVEGDFNEAIDCNCSMCRRRGGLLAFVGGEAVTLKTPREKLSTYRFNKERINHHFCATCGISPFSEGTGPDGKPTASINLRCVPGVDLGSLKIVRYDGANH